MDKKVEYNLEAAVGHNKERSFEQEVDDFIFGGFVDWIRRDETGCYVLIRDAWIPVVDWKKKHRFPGERNLTTLARYFYNLGQMEGQVGDLSGSRRHVVTQMLSGNHLKKVIELYNDEGDCQVGDVVHVLVKKCETK